MKRWLKYVKPYLPYFILGPLCMIIEVLGEVLMPKYLAQIINFGAAYQSLKSFSIPIFDGAWSTLAIPEVAETLTSTSIWYMIGICGMIVLTALLMMAGGVGGAYFGAKAAVYFASDIRRDVYAKVQSFSFANIDKFSTGSLVTRLTNDITQMQNFVNALLRMALRSPGMLIGGLVMAITLKPRLSLVLAVTIPLMLLSILLIVTRGFSMFAKVQERIDGLNNTVQESITNVRVVKSFVREKQETDKFKAANRDLRTTGTNAVKIMITLSPVMTLFMNATIIAVLWFGGHMVVDGMPIGDLSAFITYVNQILNSLMMVTFLLMMSSRALASCKRVGEVLDEKLDLDDAEAKCKEKQVMDGKIEFKNVSFRYFKNSEDRVLSDINLTIEAGSTVGIIGPTGCGKTSLVSMIPRLYDVDEGQVLVDGVDVRDYSLYHLREGVGMVLQKNVLFSGTIEENLRWGNQDATEEQIRTAAEHAQAHKFIQNFPAGYDTNLDQGGTNVSGGQKQRLCIARALLKNPKILILDDSTSAVDTATEAQIRAAFAGELKGSTKIIIAQRISSVMDADCIVVMDQGEITGIGTHAELLENNEEYKEIYVSQMESKQNQAAMSAAKAEEVKA
ncbi:MAG: ABC transporter ATP-binding protein [Ruminococcaceae bacterium]|nr:ABC transporter ATP-binding protein [Oscillospiraceae bacterium]